MQRLKKSTIIFYINLERLFFEAFLQLIHLNIYQNDKIKATNFDNTEEKPNRKNINSLIYILYKQKLSKCQNFLAKHFRINKKLLYLKTI